jgi:hypothetical protein
MEPEKTSKPAAKTSRRRGVPKEAKIELNRRDAKDAVKRPPM